MGKALVVKNVDFSGNALAQVTIEADVPCTALALNKNSVTFDTLGQTETIVATPTPANTTDIILWESSNSNVVSVQNGTLTANGIGTATITALCGTASASINVTITLLKMNDIVIVQGYYPASSNEIDNAIGIWVLSSQYTVGQSYDADDNGYHIVYGSSKQVQGIIVPYGATKAKICGENPSNRIYGKVLIGDGADPVTISGNAYAKYLTAYDNYLDYNYDVVYGQCLIARCESENVLTYIDHAEFT